MLLYSLLNKRTCSIEKMSGVEKKPTAVVLPTAPAVIDLGYTNILRGKPCNPIEAECRSANEFRDLAHALIDCCMYLASWAGLAESDLLLLKLRSLRRRWLWLMLAFAVN